MSKKIAYACLLPLLVLSGSVLAANPLLQVRTASAAIPADGYSNNCTLYDNGQVVINHTVSLFHLPNTLSAKEVKTLKISTQDIKAVINEAAMGNITGNPLAGAVTYQYFAYQKQADKSQKEIFLLDKAPAVSFVNDSAVVAPLVSFIDSVCGDITNAQ